MDIWEMEVIYRRGVYFYGVRVFVRSLDYPNAIRIIFGHQQA